MAKLKSGTRIYGNATIDSLLTVGTVNNVAITTPATLATLTLAQGSTLATSGGFSTTLTATATTNVTLPTSGTLATTAGTLTSSASTTQSGYFGDIFLFDDSTPSHYLGITNSANLTAARTLSINVNDADRTLSLSGNLTVSSAATISGTNTGDQTITLTGDVTGSGTGSFAATIAGDAVTFAKMQNSAAAGLSVVGRSANSAGDFAEIAAGTDGHVLYRASSTSLTFGQLPTASIANDAVTYAKIQNVSATDRILGRSTSGAGDIEEITCTAAGRALLDDADAAAQRTTLGLGTLATQNGTLSGTNTGDQTITLTGDVTGSGTGSFAATIASDAVTYSKIQNVSATDRLLGRVTAGAGDIEEITCTAAGRALLDDADATAQRTTLGLGTIATQASSSVSITGGSIAGLTGLLVGTSTARSNFFNSTNSARFQIEGSGSNDNYALSIVSNYAGGTNGAQVILAKSGGSNVGDNTLVSNGNTIGQISFQGADGTEFVQAASITGEVDGTPGANDMPGRLVFSTTADGASSPTERLRITSAGNVGIGTSSPGYPLTVNGRISYSGAIGEGADTTLSSSSTTLIVGDSATWQNLALRTNGNNRLYINSSGNVGIGTTSPSQVLDVKGIIQTTGVNGWTTNGDTAWVYFGDNNNRIGGTRGGTIGFYSDYAPLELGAGGGVGSSSGTQLITFKTGTSERARINSSGNVGIGTSSPISKLDVRGDLTVGDSNRIYFGTGVNRSVYNKATFGNTNFYYIWASLTDGTPNPFTIIQNSNDYPTITISSQTLTYVTGTQPSGNVIVNIRIYNNTIDTLNVRTTGVNDYDDSTVFEIPTSALGGGTQNLRFAILKSGFKRPVANYISLGDDNTPTDISTKPGLLKIGTAFNNLNTATVNPSNIVSVGFESFQGKFTSGLIELSVSVGSSNYARARSVDRSVAIGHQVGTSSQYSTYSVGIGYQVSQSRNSTFDVGIGMECLGESSPRGTTEITHTVTAQPTVMPADGTTTNVLFTDKAGSKVYFYYASITVSGGAITSVIRSLVFVPTTLPAVNDVMYTTSTLFAGMELTIASVTEIGGGYNVAVGGWTLRYIDGSSNNTAIGYMALNTVGTGSSNIGLGSSAGSAITTGSSNVVIGSNTGSSIATLSNNIILSDGSGNIRQFIDSAGNVGIGTTGPAYKLEVNGSFAATTKSFVIPHPTKEGYRLRHGSLEGPENGVYVRGRSDSRIIELPEYWTGLVDPDSITVNLTPIGQNSSLWVERIEDNKVYVGRGDTSVSYFYTVFAERVDVPTLDVEIKIEEDE